MAETAEVKETKKVEKTEEKKVTGTDFKSTFIAGIIPKIADVVARIIPKKFYDEYIREHTVYTDVLLPGIGLLIKKITNLTPEQDSLITEGMQELAQSLQTRKYKDDEEAKETLKLKAVELQDIIAKIITSMTASGDKKKINTVVNSFNNFLRDLIYEDRERVSRMLSTLTPQAFVDFILLSKKKKQDFLANYANQDNTIVSDKLEGASDFLKGIMENLKTGIGAIDKAFAPKGPAGKRISKLSRQVNKFHKDSFKDLNRVIKNKWVIW